MKRTSVALLLASQFAGIQASGQTTPNCGPIAQDFENTSGSMAGFTGDLTLGTDGTNSYLKKGNVIPSGVYTVTSPTYQLPANATSIGYGFVLGGTQNVARAYIKVMYISTLNNEMSTVILSQVVPAYTSGNPTTEVCETASLAGLPGFPAGGQYRLRIELTPNSGSGLANDMISFDDFRTNGPLSQAPLPVNFISFEAKKFNNAVQLTWQVAGEENVARYEVQRSADGRRFNTISSMNPHGKDTYHYTENSSLNTVYYRVKNVDNDGKFKYSTIVRIANGQSEIVLRAFPQPVQNQLLLQHPVISGRALISLSASNGRIVQNLVPANGSMQTPVDMSPLPKGLYLLRFDTGSGEIQTLKVLKQ